MPDDGLTQSQASPPPPYDYRHAQRARCAADCDSMFEWSASTIQPKVND